MFSYPVSVSFLTSDHANPAGYDPTGSWNVQYVPDFTLPPAMMAGRFEVIIYAIG